MKVDTAGHLEMKETTVVRVKAFRSGKFSFSLDLTLLLTAFTAYCFYCFLLLSAYY